MADEHTFGMLFSLNIDADGPPPTGAAFGQVIALPVYVAPDGPNGERGAVEYPVPAGKQANHTVLSVVWAGYPSTGRGGKAWEG
jgi:hypothetical protein